MRRFRASCPGCSRSRSRCSRSASSAHALLSIRLVRASYGLFAAAVLLANPLTGTFGSSTRYIFLAWPIFVLAARYLRQDRALLAVSVILSFGLAFFGLLFVHGYWV